MFTTKLLDLIFPPVCVGCQTIGRWICNECAPKSLVINEEECLYCRENSKGFETHMECLEKCGIKKGIVCWKYGEVEKKIMSAFKYNYRFAISSFLVERMCEHTIHFINKDYLVTCIPLHPQKQRDRGFNQSELLTKGLCNYFKFDFIQALERTSDSPQHAGMKRKERLNDENPFELIESTKEKLKNRDILIVDDVCTTGSTLFNCAQKLQQANPKSINSIVLFRGLK